MALSRRVLSIPHDNGYVRAACPPEALASLALTSREARGWDLHPAFSPGWVSAHRGDFDIVHLHFGFERLSLASLRRWLAELRLAGVPLVLTVHDLANPHLLRQEHHEGALQVLLAEAAEVITLTPGAASELTSRYGRGVTVLPHPGLLKFSARRSLASPPTVGVYLKARAQVVEPDAIVAAVLRGAERAGARVRVDAHPSLDAPGTASLAREGRLSLDAAGYLDDEAFAAYLAGLDVSVLPYRFGTHSGWLEACRDVGTAVVAPDCGYYAEQWGDIVTYRNNVSAGLDAPSLTEAVALALSRPRPAPADPAFRSQQREAVRDRHRAVYAALADERVAA